MSDFYRAERTRNIYDPKSSSPFKISRSKLELFVNCPRCFYFDRRLGIGQPPGYPFNLNSAVDALLKKEFDQFRERGEPHPLMTKNGIDAVPFRHERLEEWRNSLSQGIQFHHKPTNLIITGGVDDIWQNKSGELIIVDYKATSKKEAVGIDAGWQDGYKRQMDLYAWLFRQNGFQVFGTGYFVYCNGLRNKDSFNQRLEFDISVIPYQVKDEWIEPTLDKAHKCLTADTRPEFSTSCDFCKYVTAVTKV